MQSHALSGNANTPGKGHLAVWQGQDILLRLDDALSVHGLVFTGGLANVANRSPTGETSRDEDPSLCLDAVREHTIFLGVTIS